MDRVRAVFLGTNGWYDTESGNTVCALIDAPGFKVVLDAGGGIRRLADYIDFSVPVYMFLSHFHIDHIWGLHVSVKFNYARGLFIITGDGGRSILDVFQNRPFTIPFADLPYDVKVIEAGDGLADLPFGATILPLRHSVPTVGIRMDILGRVIAYCPDTGYCANAVELARGSDLLIAECSYRPGETHPEWPHLNPGDAARIASEAGAKSLALTHFDASRYGTRKDRIDARSSAKKTFRNTTACFDGTVIDL